MRNAKRMLSVLVVLAGVCLGTGYAGADILFWEPFDGTEGDNISTLGWTNPYTYGLKIENGANIATPIDDGPMAWRQSYWDDGTVPQDATKNLEAPYTVTPTEVLTFTWVSRAGGHAVTGTTLIANNHTYTMGTDAWGWNIGALVDGVLIANRGGNDLHSSAFDYKMVVSSTGVAWSYKIHGAATWTDFASTDQLPDVITGVTLHSEKNDSYQWLIVDWIWDSLKIETTPAPAVYVDVWGKAVPGYSGSLEDIAIKIEFIQNGEVVRTVRKILGPEGDFLVPNVQTGVYQVKIKACCWMSKTSTWNFTGATDMGTINLNGGDINGDDKVDVSDLGVLAANYGSSGSFAMDAQAVGLATASEPKEAATTSKLGTCGAAGLPLIAGFVLAFLGLGLRWKR